MMEEGSAAASRTVQGVGKVWTEGAHDVHAAVATRTHAESEEDPTGPGEEFPDDGRADYSRTDFPIMLHYVPHPID